MTKSWDLLVLGAGSGGVRAARRAAEKGVRTAICESAALGGTCVNLGCVPKKLFVYGSQVADEILDAKGYGWQISNAQFHWPTLVSNKNKEIKRLNGIYERLLKDAGVCLLRGQGRLFSPQGVEVDGHRHNVEHILIATGSYPFLPNIPGVEYAVSSDAMFHLPSLPEQAVVVGGGYIGVEFACILQGLGVQVTLVHRRERLLPLFDEEICEVLCKSMKARGIRFLFGRQVQQIEKLSEGQLRVQLDNQQQISCGLVLFAVGRVANTQGLGLAEVGVQLSAKGGIQVNEQFCSSVPSISALGDVIERVQLTPVAIAEAEAFVSGRYEGKFVQIDYAGIPSAVFSQPALASVGMTESKARAQLKDVKVFTTRFSPMKQALGPRKDPVFFKMVVNPIDDKVLGCHILGPEAAEMIQLLGVAIKSGATKADFDATIGVHPTAAEEWVSL